MEPIRILQVFTILNRGGAEANVMNYYRNINRDKIQFDFLVHRQEKGAFEEEIRMLGGRVFRLPPINPFTLKSYKKQVKMFFDENPGYQIIHGQLSELGVFIYEEAKRRNIPVIIAHAHNSRMSLDAKALFRQWWKIRMRKSVNTFFTCGQDSAKWLFGEKNAKEAYTMNNAVDAVKFKFNPQIREKIRKQLMSFDKINIVNVARFDKQKNHIFLLEVFAEIISLNSNYHLYLIGNGDLKEQITKKIEELKITNYVTLLGERSDINDVLQAMDIFLFPSLFEGLPVSFIEAQASGIRSVVSTGIPNEAIIIQENVKVLSFDDSKLEWAKQIIGFSNYLRVDVSDSIIINNYDIRNNAAKLEKKYTELLIQKS